MRKEQRRRGGAQIVGEPKVGNLRSLAFGDFIIPAVEGLFKKEKAAAGQRGGKGMEMEGSFSLPVSFWKKEQEDSRSYEQRFAVRCPSAIWAGVPSWTWFGVLGIGCKLELNASDPPCTH